MTNRRQEVTILPITSLDMQKMDNLWMERIQEGTCPQFAFDEMKILQNQRVAFFMDVAV